MKYIALAAVLVLAACTTDRTPPQSSPAPAPSSSPTPREPDQPIGCPHCDIP